MSDIHYKEVQADKWDKMSVNDLYEQLSILRSRSYTAAIMNNIPLLDQINRGIEQCEDVIAGKSDDDGTITL